VCAISAFLFVIVFSVAFLMAYSKKKGEPELSFYVYIRQGLLGCAIRFGIGIVAHFVIRIRTLTVFAHGVLMHLIGTHRVMIHGARAATVRMQHRASGIGVPGIDLAVIDIIRGDILFCIRGDLSRRRRGIRVTVVIC
jgi:hypothetical protein